MTISTLVAVAGVAVGGECIRADLSFPASPAFLRCGRTVALSTCVRQESGDWLVLDGMDFDRFAPANEKGRLAASEGSLAPRVVTHASELKYFFWLTAAGRYDVWCHVKFPRRGFYNHSESMDHGTPRVIHDSEDPAAPGQWLPPDEWHWVKTTTYDLVRGPHHWFWLPPGAWCAGCELDRIVLLRAGSKVAPATATAANRRVERSAEATLVAKRVKLSRLAAWTFAPVFDAGDGRIVFERSGDGKTWRPLETGTRVAVGPGENYLHIRVRMTAPPPGGRPPVLYDYAFSVERREEKVKVRGEGEGEGVRPLRIVPNKIVYSLGETGWATVVLTNTSAKTETARAAVTESWDVGDESRTIWTGDVALGPREGQSIKVDWPGSTVRYGHELRVTVSNIHSPTPNFNSSRSEYFNVNSDWWRVCLGGNLSTADGSLTPSVARILDYYGYPTSVWQKAGFYLNERWAAHMPDMGPFDCYNNLETRWQLQRSSVGGNAVTLTEPDGKKWPNTQNHVRRTGDIRRDTVLSHERGFRHTRYTIGYLNAAWGFELARKHPEFVNRTDRGQFAGYYMNDPRVRPDITAQLDTFHFTPFLYLEPNFFRADATEAALADLVKTVSALGEDGVYFDGRYMQHKGFDAFGSDLGRQPAADEAIVRNMKMSLERIFAANPNAFVWSNGCTAENPELTLADHPQTGLLKETQWPFLLNPARPDHSYRGFREGLVRFRNSVWKGGKYVKNPSKILNCGYLMTSFDQKRALACGESWVMASHIISIIAGIAAHPLAYPAPFRPFKQMMTRYSEFFWHEDLSILDDAEKSFSVDSLREIWWRDTVYVRETPDFVQYTVHLMNAPEGEFCDEAVLKDPPAADDVDVSTRLFGAADRVRAWAIAPHARDAARLEPTCREIVPQRTEGETSFSVPPFRYYTLLVVRKYKERETDR